MATANKENHATGRIGWLRAAVLGANDGILSTSSLVLGVAAAHATHSSILLVDRPGGRCKKLGQSRRRNRLVL